MPAPKSPPSSKKEPKKRSGLGLSPCWLILASFLMFFVFGSNINWMREELDPKDYLNFVPFGCTLQEKELTTEDGYILTVFVVHDPKHFKESLPPVYLQHGFGSHGASWLLLKEKSAVAALARKGFKVYLLSSRGTPFSNKHIKYTSDQAEYWDFSFEDLPKDMIALNNFISKYHSKRVIYIGHSQGAVQALAGLSDERFKERLSKQVLKMYLSAPVFCTADHQSLPLYLGEYLNSISEPIRKLGLINKQGKTVIPTNSFSKLMEKIFNTVCGLDHRICFWAYPASDKSHIKSDMSIYGTWARYHLTSVPIKGMAHFGQVAYSNRFVRQCAVRRYDYGSSENKRIYGKADPPILDPSKVKIPMWINMATQDRYYGLQDIEATKEFFKENKEVQINVDEDWGHNSYPYGTETHKLFEKIAEDIQRL